jgi:hypothetical protein
MIYGELGRYPVEIDIKIIIISFWAKIICGKQSLDVFFASFAKNKTEIIEVFDYFNFGAIIFKR